MSELDRASLDRTLPPRSGFADWDEVLRGAGAVRERRVQRLVAVVAALLVLVVGTASAFGTVRDLLGYGARPAEALHTLQGKRGSFFLRDDPILDTKDLPRGWRIEVVQGGAPGGLASTGQYAHVTGRGSYVQLRPITSPRSPRLEGIVTRPGKATQRIVITEKFTGKRGVHGVFVLTPLEPGILKRDSGTVTITRG